MTAGEFIRQKRNREKMSQEQLARIIGISETYLDDIERGGKALTLELFIGVITAFDMEKDESTELAHLMAEENGLLKVFLEAYKRKEE